MPALARLQSDIQAITRSINADWGVYIKLLHTGEEIALDADRRMDTMSVIKIPILVEAFAQIERGAFALTDRCTLRRSDFLPGTGILHFLDEGDSVTVKDLLTLMINVSDDTATDLIYARIGGPEAVTRSMRAMGFATIEAPRTVRAWFEALAAASSPVAFHRDGTCPFGLASPRDIGRLLEKLERGEVVSPAACALMLDMMRTQLYGTRIPRYINQRFRIPHKTGDFLPFIGNDAGVIESLDGGQRIVICVFTAHHYGVGSILEHAIGRIAERISEYVVDQGL